MATDAEKRDQVKRLYPYDSWHQKVAKMSPQQVHAIWVRAIESKKH